jgi:hypothetical protein
MYIYIYEYMYVCICREERTQPYQNVQVWEPGGTDLMCIYIYIYIYIYVHVSIYMYMNICMYT